jgi:hypothetical protein
VDAREQAAEHRDLLVAELVGCATTRARPDRVVDALDRVQAVAIGEAQRCTHRDLHLAQIEEIAVLLEHCVAAPAARAIELHHHVARVVEADVVDAVLQTDERRAVPRRNEARGLHRAQHALGSQLEEEPIHPVECSGPARPGSKDPAALSLRALGCRREPGTFGDGRRRPGKLRRVAARWPFR